MNSPLRNPSTLNRSSNIDENRDFARFLWVCPFLTHERYRVTVKTMAADRGQRPPRRFHRSLSTNTSTYLVTRRFVEDTVLEIIYISAERWTFNDKTVTNHGPLVLAIGSEVRSFLSTFSHAWLLLIVIKRAKVPTRDSYLLFFILFFYFFPGVGAFYHYSTLLRC